MVVHIDIIIKENGFDLLTNDSDYNKISFVAEHVTDVRLAQLDRAFGYGPKGREFESSNARERKPCMYMQGFLLYRKFL